MRWNLSVSLRVYAYIVNFINPRPAGGGGRLDAPLRFFSRQQKTAARSAAKFGIPYLASFSHIVCENQPQVPKVRSPGQVKETNLRKSLNSHQSYSDEAIDMYGTPRR